VGFLYGAGLSWPRNFKPTEWEITSFRKSTWTGGEGGHVIGGPARTTEEEKAKKLFERRLAGSLYQLYDGWGRKHPGSHLFSGKGAVHGPKESSASCPSLSLRVMNIDKKEELV